MGRRLLISWILAVAMIATACGSSSGGDPGRVPATLPDTLVPGQPSEETPTTATTTTATTTTATTTTAAAGDSSAAVDAPEDAAATAQSTCERFEGSRFGDRQAALTAGRDQVGFALDDAMITLCPDAYEEFETLEDLAFNSANVNQNVTLAASCDTNVSVELVNHNEFTIDAGVLVQIGSAEVGAVGGSTVLALGIGPGETRQLEIDPREVGTDLGANSCGAQLTAWQAETGPTATIFGIDDPIEDPAGRQLPQTRTNDPATLLTELIDYELSLFGDPDGAAIEEFEDVRSPNFLRLIAEFDARKETGERVEFQGGEISGVEVIERPRDDLMLLGWTSAPATITFFDADGSEVRSSTFGSRVRRGIFLRSPVDGRWRWVHSAFTVIEEGGEAQPGDDSVTA